ncbi:MAG: hypothetical protein KDA60_03695 [Planctomycetales bacterium]|nr:hypothetical protein [Planctomycetales bacterium]
MVAGFPPKISRWGAILITLWWTVPVIALDELRLLPDAKGEQRVISGEIEDIREGQILIRVGTSTRPIPVLDVVQIESTWQPAHRSADHQLSHHAWDAALIAYRQAYEAEQRPWCRRLLVKQMAVALQGQGQDARAALLLLQILEVDPASTYVSNLPLAWPVRARTAAEQQQASLWIDESLPAAQLLGASWLLVGNERQQALNTLSSLTEHTNPLIAQLALAQIWRVTPASSEPALAQRRELVAKFHSTIQAGPRFVLIEAARNDAPPADIAIDLLRIPILYPEQTCLVPEALAAAAEVLRNNDRVDEASLVTRELVHNYPQTLAGSTASSMDTGSR